MLVVVSQSITILVAYQRVIHYNGYIYAMNMLTNVLCRNEANKT